MSDSLIADSWTLQDGISMTVLQNPLRTREFYVPPHWHAVHDEIHVILKGRVIVSRNGVRHVVGPEDGACLTWRGVIHSLESCSLWRRLRRRLRMWVPHTKLVTRSGIYFAIQTEQKIYFFCNLGVPGILRTPLDIIQVFYYGYSYPNFPLGCDGSNDLWICLPAQ
ncbi:hypothetical protein DFH08DRAFT_812643 [Mycena albidolilacea]|uniref:Uncharacterized protein n=1 Tax=Mycena albidolilacea TaxID=1033008 RepID=A0AAD6ZV44_9AGAR|nr:hypothetical protein DFH08DRAFT_812643 [Mycena albidolilacea]